MHSIGSKLMLRSAGTFRRLLLSNTAYNVRVIQTPLSCLACRQFHVFHNEHGVKNIMTRFTLNNVAAYNGRFQSTAQGSEGTVGAVENGGTWIDRIIRVLRVVAAPLVKKTVLVGGARNMYESCVEGMNFEEFFEVSCNTLPVSCETSSENKILKWEIFSDERTQSLYWMLKEMYACELPDTLQSWFLVLHLHIWMCLVRLKAEGKDGRYVYKTLVRMMWLDVEERIDNLGTIDSVQKRDTLQVLQQQFYGITIGYDEGLLCDDTVLATVLWRNLFHNKTRTDAEQLGRLVEYVRKNIQHLDSLPREHVLQDGRITWLPLNEQAEEEKEKKERGGL